MVKGEGREENGGDCMRSNRLQGTLDQLQGIGRELWGELVGDVNKFNAGLRQRMIGRLEAKSDMNHDDAERQVDQTMH